MEITSGTTLRDLLDDDLKQAWNFETEAVTQGNFIDAAFYRGRREGIQFVLRKLGVQ